MSDGARLALVVGLSLVFAACSSGTRSSSGSLQITAAFYPLAFVAERIGGSAVDVANLTPPGAEPHDLELRPSDVTRVKSADLVLYLRGFQPAVDDAVRGLGSRAFDALSSVPAKTLSDGEVDPHFWLDPITLQAAARAIEGRMEAASVKNRDLFRQNLSSLEGELTLLDGTIRSGLQQCARHEIFTGHVAFAYLAGRYGLRQIGITGLNPEAEPSPRRLTNIIRLAEALHPTVVFAEELVSSRSVDAVAHAVGARVRVLNPLEGLLPEQRSLADYFSLMRDNVRILGGGLGCRPAA